jgi:polar amino acid transport system substrate-binding protein
MAALHARGTEGSDVRLTRTWLAIAALAALAAAGVVAVNVLRSDATKSGEDTVDAAAVLHSLLPEAIRQRGTIKVATDMGYAPFEYFASDGRTPVGLDIDLMRALEPLLGLRFDISDTTYANIIPSLQSGRYDIGWSAIVVASLGGTGTVNFLVYIDPAIDSLLVSSGNNSIRKPLDLCGKTFGFLHAEKSASTDAASARCRQAGRQAIKWRLFQKTPDIILALESGQVDARVAHIVNGRYYVKASAGKLKLVRGALPTRPLTMGVAVPVGRPDLEQAIRGGLQRLIADGTYSQILSKYGAASVGVRRITVLH